MEDTATPYEPYTGKIGASELDTTAGRDGYLDLVFKFETQQLVAALGEVHDSAMYWCFNISGNLKQEMATPPSWVRMW